MTSVDEIESLRVEVLAARASDAAARLQLDAVADILAGMAGLVGASREERSSAAFGLFRTVTDDDRLADSSLGHRILRLSGTFDTT
jgi:hypothetical protein